MSKLRANTFGFYALNGTSVIDFKQNSKKESVCEFLTRIRGQNPKEKIVIFLDRFSSHRAGDTIKCAELLGIRLVFLPPYSPDLNPIEYIWKSIKRVISISDIENKCVLIEIISDSFFDLTANLSSARMWIPRFLHDKLNLLC